MAVDDQPVAFNRAGAKRIVRATQIVENQYRNQLQGSRYGGARSAGVVPAVTSTSISAKSGSTAGSGNVTLYEMDAAGAMTATGVTLKCWNMGGEVASGKDVLVDFGTRGPWLVVVPCS